MFHFAKVNRASLVVTVVASATAAVLWWRGENFFSRGTEQSSKGGSQPGHPAPTGQTSRDALTTLEQLRALDAPGQTGAGHWRNFLYLKDHPGLIDEELLDLYETGEPWEQMLALFLYLETSTESHADKIARFRNTNDPWILQELAGWVFRKASREEFDLLMDEISQRIAQSGDFTQLFQLVRHPTEAGLLKSPASSVLGMGLFRGRFLSDLTERNRQLATLTKQALAPDSKLSNRDRLDLIHLLSDFPNSEIPSILQETVTDARQPDQIRWYALQLLIASSPREQAEAFLKEAAASPGDSLQEDYLKALDHLVPAMQMRTMRLQEWATMARQHAEAGRLPPPALLRKISSHLRFSHTPPSNDPMPPLIASLAVVGEAAEYPELEYALRDLQSFK